ncbi:MAG: hypothetical protein NC434_07965 [Ruminococcus sp.]|nr:hypothetical protein [Ruminococcus sp.]
MKKYGFDSVQAFYKVFNTVRREYLNYKATCAIYEKTYGGRVADITSIRERLQQKGQEVKEREACS